MISDMPDYKKGKIYCIRSHQTDVIYIGSTVQPLHKRFYVHKKNYKLWNGGKYGYTTSYELIRYDDCYIELLEECPCDNRNQLERREGQLIRDLDCVNKTVSGRSKKEYREEHKEQIKEAGKKYYEEHKEQIKEARKKYYEEHKEKLAERCKKYRENNKEKLAERDKKYYEEHKEKIKEYREAHKNDFKCEICNYSGDKSGYNRHLKTKKHINSIEA